MEMLLSGINGKSSEDPNNLTQVVTVHSYYLPFITYLMKISMGNFIQQIRVSPVPLNLLGLTLLAVSLLVFRFYWTGTFTYWSLTWNLFLAFIPLFISALSVKLIRTSHQGLIFAPLFGLWLLFFPNAPYILTDLFHLQTRGGMPKWFDLLLVLSFAWTGLIFGIISLMQIQSIVSKLWGNAIGWMIAMASIVLGSFGIYLGRYLRWNSWDIVTAPRSLLKDIYYITVDPFAHPRTVGMTLAFSAFLILVYLTIKSLRSDRVMDTSSSS